MTWKIFGSNKAKPKSVVYNALISSLAKALFAWIALTIILCLLGGFFWNKAGLWGALMGVGIGCAFFIISICISLFAITQPPLSMMMITLGAWLIKILIFIVILALLAKKHFYSHPIFAIAVLCSIVFVLGAQVYAMRLKNIPIIDDVTFAEDQLLLAENKVEQGY